MVDASLVAKVLGIRGASLADLIEAVSHGLPKQALVRSTSRAFRERSAARRLQHRIVPEATFKRRTRLSRAESERTERLARVVASAEHVWHDRGDARTWLSTPQPELTGQTPIESALTELGARRVEMILDRIEYGLPA